MFEGFKNNKIEKHREEKINGFKKNQRNFLYVSALVLGLSSAGGVLANVDSRDKPVGDIGELSFSDKSGEESFHEINGIKQKMDVNSDHYIPKGRENYFKEVNTANVMKVTKKRAEMKSEHYIPKGLENPFNEVNTADVIEVSKNFNGLEISASDITYSNSFSETERGLSLGIMNQILDVDGWKVELGGSVALVDKQIFFDGKSIFVPIPSVRARIGKKVNFDNNNYFSAFCDAFMVPSFKLGDDPDKFGYKTPEVSGKNCEIKFEVKF
jgi:hypothetical protein